MAKGRARVPLACCSLSCNSALLCQGWALTDSTIARPFHGANPHNLFSPVCFKCKLADHGCSEGKPLCGNERLSLASKHELGSLVRLSSINSFPEALGMSAGHKCQQHQQAADPCRLHAAVTFVSLRGLLDGFDMPKTRHVPSCVPNQAPIPDCKREQGFQSDQAASACRSHAAPFRR